MAFWSRWDRHQKLDTTYTAASYTDPAMVNITTVADHGPKSHKDDVAIAQAEAPEFDKVQWTKEPHLRRLYAWGAILMVASATTGYDG